MAKKLERAFLKGMEGPEFRSVCEKLYLTPYPKGSADFEREVKDKWPRTEKMFKEIGIIQEAATQPR